MIYFDNSATTFVDKRVLDVFNKVCIDYPGNSNSIHSLGVKSKELEDYSTKKIAQLLNVNVNDIIYTSGASESNNLAIKGICLKYQNRGKHIITTYLEHSSVSSTIDYLVKNGFEVDYVKITDEGLIDIEHLKSLIREDTILVSLSYVDSEIGLVQPINEIGLLLKDYPKCFFHVDCTQGLGKIDIDFSLIDLASMSGHKIFGLKGIGLLIKKEKIVIEPLIHGGKSTTIYRSGTPALPLIVSMMKAIELVKLNMDNSNKIVNELNERLVNGLKKYDKVHINSTNNSLKYVINFSILGIKPETFVHALEEYDIYISTKSACSSNDSISSSVYALTKNREYSLSSLRVSFSHLNTIEEVDKFLEIFDKCYNKLLLK